MNIIFSDLFRQECETKFGISETDVQQAIANPDTQDIVELNGLVLGFFVKQDPQHGSGTYLLVCTQKQIDDWLVLLAFRLLPDLICSAGTLQPMVLLQALVQEFGLVIRVGHQFNKFIFREVIPLKDEGDDPTQLVEVINPSNHSFAQNICASGLASMEMPERPMSRSPIALIQKSMPRGYLAKQKRNEEMNETQLPIFALDSEELSLRVI